MGEKKSLLVLAVLLELPSCGRGVVAWLLPLLLRWLLRCIFILLFPIASCQFHRWTDTPSVDRALVVFSFIRDLFRVSKIEISTDAVSSTTRKETSRTLCRCLWCDQNGIVDRSVDSIMFFSSRAFPKHALQLLLLIAAALLLFSSAEEAVATESVVDAMELRHPCPHEIAAVVSLTDETFEHTTQASSGQTTGSWLIWFYNATGDAQTEDRAFFTDAFPELEVWNAQHMVVAAVNVHGTGRQTQQRFAMESSNDLPAFLYIHQGKMYRYPRASTYSWKDLLVFGQNPGPTATPQDIPPPPSLLHAIVAKLAGNPTLLSGVMVLIMMVGAFIAAVTEHFGPAKKPLRLVPGEKTKAE
jgi:hypothetical protein